MIAGETAFDEFTRGLYSTDASIYQVTPRGVVFPRSARDVRRCIEIASAAGEAVIARGAGTSQSGQSIGTGIVLDTSRHLNRILDLDPTRRRVTVEPGIVLDDLNRFLRPYGLFFPIDVATSNRATIGGMAGNNSAGARSIRYGHMVEHVRGIQAILPDASEAWFAGAESGKAPRRLEQRIRAIYEQEKGELARRVPKVPRHVAGYALHRLAKPDRGLSDLLVGSEGTLAFFTQLELEVQPIPTFRALGVCSFASTRDALSAVPGIVELNPTAVELVDGQILGLAAQIPSFEKVIRSLVHLGKPGSRDILVVEFASDDPGVIQTGLMALEAQVGHVSRAESESLMERIWGLRKAGLSISMSQPVARKPLAFIEDCSIPLHRLAEWYDGLTKILDNHGTHAVWYAHASVGCLHVRPALDLRSEDDRGLLKAIADDAFKLAADLGGSFSGEHGDGWIRSEFIEPMLGPRLTAAFRRVKDAFDPDHRLNPGKIVDPPSMNDPELVRARHSLKAVRLATSLNWSSAGGFGAAVDMCNNNATCRKQSTGTMCPSYRATRDERHSTRGRANALRLALSGQLGSNPWSRPELHEALDLCLGCKACRRECPTGVDMARMKIEYAQQLRKHRPLSPREGLLAWLPRYAPLAARARPLVNLRNNVPALAAFGERFLGLASNRSIPRWERPFRDSALPVDPTSKLDAASAAKSHGGKVAVLFVDTFTRYMEPAHAHAMCRIAKHAGYTLHTPSTDGRSLCCGRTFLNAGLIAEARRELARTAEALAPAASAGIPIVGLEPSCLLTLRDELPALLPGRSSEQVASQSRLLTEWILEEDILPTLNLEPLPVSAVHVHGHCHEKAFGAWDSSLDVLNAIPALDVHPIPAGCCGMAGSFGYEQEHAAISKRVWDLALAPAIAEVPAAAWVVANGTSCRHQIADFSQVQARHIATVLEEALAE